MSKLLSRKVLVPAAILIAALVIFCSSCLSPELLSPKSLSQPKSCFILFGFPITNTLLATWLTMILLIVGVVGSSRAR